MKARGAIIAGGAAARFGGDPKGLALVGGRRIVDRLVDAFVGALGQPPLLVANAADAQTWRPDLRVFHDVRPGCGALGGLYAAIHGAPAPVVCVAWDMPFVSAELIKALADRLGAHDAMLPESIGPGGLEPLCAAYGPGSGPAMGASLDAGEYRATAFHSGIRLGVLPLAEVRQLGDPARLFFNVNTRADLETANRMIASEGQSDP